MNTPPTNANLMQSPEFRLAMIAVGVFALMSFLSPERFLSTQNLTSMAFQFPEFAILALAMTITMMTGGIDLSVVGIANFTAVIAATILTRFSGPEMSISLALLWFGIAIFVSLVIGAICGYINGALVAYFGLPPILATVGSGLVFTGFAVAMTGGSAVMGFPEVVAWLGNERLFSIPVPLIVFAVMAIGLHIGLTRTSFGLKVTMYGANPMAALFAAIDINRMLLKVYIMSGMFSAVAGLVIMSRANSAKADYGSSYLLLAVLIAVLGGVNPYGGYGRVVGVVLAVLSMQFLSSGLNMLQVSNFARELIWGALLIFVMVINTTNWAAFRMFRPGPAKTG
uniref:ABC transporter permease n=1 Tax=Pararhizobium sp. IMCC3301 TaxID=3067904 RepID=UPI002741CA5E|nr:ABC transporter permease [Pararhizobium sp. IMCC3301]